MGYRHSLVYGIHFFDVRSSVDHPRDKGGGVGMDGVLCSTSDH